MSAYLPPVILVRRAVRTSGSRFSPLSCDRLEPRHEELAFVSITLE